jgi:hypothetical protein
MDLPHQRHCLYHSYNQQRAYYEGFKHLFKHGTPSFVGVALVFELGASPAHILQLYAAPETSDTSPILQTQSCQILGIILMFPERNYLADKLSDHGNHI